MKACERYLLMLLVGAVLGALAYDVGVRDVCPKANCVDSAKVEAVVDDQYYPTAYKVLSGARDSILISTFEFKYYRAFPESLQNKLVREVIYAKERGVDVKILVDEFSTENNAMALLLANGVDIRYDGNESTTHTKLLIVDGEIVLVGSTNFSYYG